MRGTLVTFCQVRRCTYEGVPRQMSVGAYKLLVMGSALPHSRVGAANKEAGD